MNSENLTAKSNVRVRFAPSPTGFFHIGSARTALFNWLYARHTNGTFVLRIEDTDEERDREEYLQVILDGMHWLGMQWDEGPEVGGPYGPYFQSQRKAVYDEYLAKLQATGRVYEKDGALYFRVSGKPVTIPDAIRGNVQRMEEKDFVIYRSNGTPVFHFVNVVDDIAMKITHVIRGEDHLSNSSKHVELFQAFGAPIPTFAHIPLILKTVGSGKMSKRDKGALIEEYQSRGFLPEAVRNFLCLLGWSPKDDREILDIEEIIRLYDLPQINKNNARFDEKKMSFINAEYVRHLPLEKFIEKASPLLLKENVITESTDPVYLENVLRICQEKVRSFEDLPNFCRYFFTEDYAFDEAAKAKIFGKGNPVERVKEFYAELPKMDTIDENSLEAKVQELAEKNNLKAGDYIHALRFAVSGQSVGPSIYHLLVVLGKERLQTRLEKWLKANA